MNDVQLDLASGKVGVRLFYGHDGADEPVPTIIYFHGGGWVVGDADTHTVTCARLAHEANALVVSVDYPLAPEAHWRTITDACFEAASAIATDRVAQDAATPSPWRATAPARISPPHRTARARRRQLTSRCRRCCIRRSRRISTHRATASSPPAPASRACRHAVVLAALRGDDQAANDYRIAPTRAASHAGLPPAYVVTAGRDRCATKGGYARQLRGAGIEVAHDEFDSLPHGFLRMAKYSAATDAAIARLNRRIGELLRASRPESPRLNFITDPWFYVWAIPAVIITGISKTGLGAGVGGVAVPMMSQVIAPARQPASCCRSSA